MRCLELCRVAVTTLRPAAPVVLLLPSVHRSAFYGGVHRARSGHVGALRGWAREKGVVTVDAAGLVGEHVLTGRGNPDGIHWGWTAHRAVGEAVAAAVGGVDVGVAEGAEPSGRRGPDRAEQAGVHSGTGTGSAPQATAVSWEDAPAGP